MSREQNRSAAVLQQEYLSCPVTAIAFYRSKNGNMLVMVGEDCWLKIFDALKSRLLGQLRIFDRQPIHGIHVRQSETGLSDEEANLLIWGARSLAVLPDASLESLVGGHSAPRPRPEQFTAPDWIYDALQSPYDRSRGVLITAHNEVIPFSVMNEAQGVDFGQLVSPSRPMLYSAKLSWLTPDSILVAAGTVFGEIIMWKCHTNHDTSSSAAYEVMFVFTGHEGSIFGVSISPELELVPGQKVRLVASCSDDRTIRVWDITEGDSTTKCKETGPELLGEARETGFLQNLEAEHHHKDDSLRCVAVAMGHISRIWHVGFTSYQRGPESLSVTLFSAGEDATTQRWELDLDLAQWRTALWRSRDPKQTVAMNTPHELSRKLRHIGTYISHSGKNVWSTTSLLDDSGGLFTASGGADGRVAVIRDAKQANHDEELKHPTQKTKGSVTTMASFDEIQKSLSRPQREETSPKDGIKCYIFLSLTDLLVVTSSGRLLLHSSKGDVPWREIDVDPALRQELMSDIVMRRPRERMVVIGCKSGRVHLLQEGKGFRQIAALQGKVTNIICLPGKLGLEGGTGTNSLLITVLRNDRAVLLTLPSSSDGPSGTRYVKLSNNPVITSAGFCGPYLIVGSRLGDVFVCAESPEVEASFSTIASRRDCRTKDAVTSIVPLPGSSSLFLTGSRDGRYRIYSLRESVGAELVFSLEHDAASPLTMIEDAWFTPAPCSSEAGRPQYELAMCGFRSKNFVVWNETSRREQVRIDCGGGQRALAFISDPTCPDRFRFVFSNGAKMHLHTQEHTPLRIIKDGGGHGREVRDVAATADGRVLATGSEDTTVRLWEYAGGEEKAGSALRCLAVLDKHAAGIQSLKWLGNEYLLTSAGNEEFFIWRVKKLESEYAGLAVLCEAVYPDRTADEDLRIMDFDVEWIHGTDKSKGMSISLVLSNSTLKSYRYSLDEGFVPLSEGRYTGACPTQIRHLRAETGLMSVLTASTDGHIAIWESRPQECRTDDPVRVYHLQTVAKLHQNTIKSLEVVREPDSVANMGWLVITGGDDNALGVLRLKMAHEGDKFMIYDKARVKSAHAAAITAVCPLEIDQHSIRVMTSSNDQQLRVWEIKENGADGPLGIALLDERYSAVADPGAVEAVRPGRVIVAGIGMEVWRMSPS